MFLSLSFLFFDKVSNFCSRFSTSQKQELLNWNCQWSCKLHAFKLILSLEFNWLHWKTLGIQFLTPSFSLIYRNRVESLLHTLKVNKFKWSLEYCCFPTLHFLRNGWYVLIERTLRFPRKMRPPKKVCLFVIGKNLISHWHCKFIDILIAEKYFENKVLNWVTRISSWNLPLLLLKQSLSSLFLFVLNFIFTEKNKAVLVSCTYIASSGVEAFF